MPAHNADLNDPKNVLRILLTAVLENGGELRLRAATYDQLDRGRLLLVDYDKRRNQIVLRATSDFGRAVVVTPEAVSWSQPVEAAPLERARIRAAEDAAKRAIPTDEELAEMEERAAANQRVASEVAEGRSPMRIKVRDAKPQ